jgi:hypothetical protein
LLRYVASTLLTIEDFHGVVAPLKKDEQRQNCGCFIPPNYFLILSNVTNFKSWATHLLIQSFGFNFYPFVEISHKFGEKLCQMIKLSLMWEKTTHQALRISKILQLPHNSLPCLKRATNNSLSASKPFELFFPPAYGAIWLFICYFVQFNG